MISFKELEEKYNFEIVRILEEINKSKAKRVLLQFPDGLKPHATTVVDYLREKTNGKVEFLIWLGSCFGACDTPVGVEKLTPKIDLLIQFGHNEMMPSF